jgi:hypothetical protein
MMLLCLPSSARSKSRSITAAISLCRTFGPFLGFGFKGEAANAGLVTAPSHPSVRGRQSHGSKIFDVKGNDDAACDQTSRAAVKQAARRGVKSRAAQKIQIIEMRGSRKIQDIVVEGISTKEARMKELMRGWIFLRAGGDDAMSALPPIADIETQSRNVRFVPKADEVHCSKVLLLDHLVGE